jgi:hypothetical protein
MRVLVCGGRDFDNERWLHLTLTEMHRSERFECVIEGGALGADRLAREWAAGMAIRVETFEADWMSHGRAAGPLRNRRMLDEGQPDLVVAFPGGKGTANMVNQSRARGVRTVVLTPSVYSHNQKRVPQTNDNAPKNVGDGMFKIQCEPIISESQPGARIVFAGVHVDVPMRVMRDIRDWFICRVDDLDAFYQRAGVSPVGSRLPLDIPKGMNGPTDRRSYTKPRLVSLSADDPRVQLVLKSLP